VFQIYSYLKNWIIGDYLSQNNDIQNQARAKLLLNTSLLVFIICIPLMIIMFVDESYGKLVPTLIGLVVVVCQLALFKHFRNIFWSTFVLCALSSVIVCININFNRNVIHLVEPFWMIDIVVFSIFMVGVRWGIIFFLTMATGYVFYVPRFFQTDLVRLTEVPNLERYFFGLEIASAVFTLVYILAMFVMLVRRAESGMQEANYHLEQQNQLITKQNTEITLLLREIHHRVKNNLQVINSLLRLQSVQIKDQASRRVFEDAQHRIKAIALIHERMYKSAELSDIEPVDYFQGLAQDLFRQNSTNHSAELIVNVRLKDWNQDMVVPMGLLLNELIANSLEHAKMEQGGVISVSLFQVENKIHLHYSDSGKGFDTEIQEGFGLELIETLCQQLSGNMSLCSVPNEGVNYEFVFQIGA
jgi:two-component system, sensor histidine kinase PdtaS